MSSFQGKRFLTDPSGNRDNIVASHPGMAHFAGTGPAGTRCCSCAHWADGRKRRTYQGIFAAGPQGRKQPCAKFKELAPRARRDPVPFDAASCKWYVPYKQQYD